MAGFTVCLTSDPSFHRTPLGMCHEAPFLSAGLWVSALQSNETLSTPGPPAARNFSSGFVRKDSDKTACKADCFEMAHEANFFNFVAASLFTVSRKVQLLSVWEHYDR